MTPFNSLMTLLSVRLRQNKLRYDLIKTIWIYIWKCSMDPENDKSDLVIKFQNDIVKDDAV